MLDLVFNKFLVLLPVILVEFKINILIKKRIANLDIFIFYQKIFRKIQKEF